MKVAFFPKDEKKTIKYLEIMKRAYSEANFEVIKDFKNADYIVLNWYENLYEEGAKVYLRFLYKLVQLNLSWRKKKIIWVMHNKIPHNYAGSLSMYLIRCLIKKADHIVIHSKESRNVLKNYLDEKYWINKTFWVPHPNFINEYGEIQANITNNQILSMLVVGSLSPYKKIENIIDAVSDMNNVKLIIRGKSSDMDYQKFLLAKASKSRNIDLKFGYISDSEFPDLLSRCHILVTPYNLTSSLNSGVQILAFSYGKTVLSTEIATLLDFEEKFFFTFKDSIESLKYEIREIVKKYDGNFNEINELGNKALTIMKEKYKIKDVSDILKDQLGVD